MYDRLGWLGNGMLDEAKFTDFIMHSGRPKRYSNSSVMLNKVKGQNMACNGQDE